MADVRINALATTATTSASDDYLAIDGSANGTRKLSAYSPTFGGNLTVSGATTLASGQYVKLGSAFFAVNDSGPGTNYLFSGGAGGIVFRNGNDTATLATLSNAGNLTVSGTGTSYIEAARSSIIGGSPRFQIESSSAPYYTSSIALIGNANSSGNEAVVMFSKSRGTTNGSVTAVQSGDTIGGLYWTGADGTSINTNAAAFLTQVDGAVSTGSVPLRYIWQIAASEKMRLNSSGNLLLGTTTDGGQKLQVSGTAAITGAVSTGSLTVNPGTTSTALVLKSSQAGSYGWQFIQDEASTGNFFIQRLVASTASDVLTLDRSNGNATFAGNLAIQSGNALRLNNPSNAAYASIFMDANNVINFNYTTAFGVTIRTQGGTASTPASASAAGIAGTIQWDASYIYVCTAANTWKRAAIATW